MSTRSVKSKSRRTPRKKAKPNRIAPLAETPVEAPPAEPVQIETVQLLEISELPPEPPRVEPAPAIEIPKVPLNEHRFEPVLCFVGTSEIKLWSHTPTERLKTQFAKEGLVEQISAEEAIGHNGPVVAVRADAVIDQPLVPILIKRPNLLLLDGERAIAAHVQGDQSSSVLAALAGVPGVEADPKLMRRRPRDLDIDFWKALRKRETPYALVVDEKNKADVEWRMFMGTYKGATDLVTKHLWPVPAFHVTRWLAPRGVTPNMVTVAAAVLTVLAFFLFLYGHYAPGLICAWAMTFLDTVDGKLARTTLTSSKWGDIFDHGIDLIHPPFWYVAWALGLAVPWSAGLFWTVIAAILGGYILQRVMEGIAIKWLGLEIHIWRPIDTLFRQVTARRNPNLVILTAFTIIGRPDWGLIAVAIWTVACLVLHGIQLVQALQARRSGPLSSWMTKRT